MNKAVVTEPGKEKQTDISKPLEVSTQPVTAIETPASVQTAIESTPTTQHVTETQPATTITGSKAQETIVKVIEDKGESKDLPTTVTTEQKYTSDDVETKDKKSKKRKQKKQYSQEQPESPQTTDPVEVTKPDTETVKQTTETTTIVSTTIETTSTVHPETAEQPPTETKVAYKGLPIDESSTLWMDVLDEPMVFSDDEVEQKPTVEEQVKKEELVKVTEVVTTKETKLEEESVDTKKGSKKRKHKKQTSVEPQEPEKIDLSKI